ncbi:cell cycle checkpoint control protein RAD9A isoform X2 [Genypterus blacodes]
MAIKSVQSVFRSLATLEKTVEKCHIELDEQKDRLTFTLHCKHGLLKTHNLSFQDSESLQAVFDKDSCANVLRVQPRVLVDTVVHFPPSLDEVTLSVSNERVWFRNHVEEDADLSKAMLTELSLGSDEFDDFTIGTPYSVTFCLKELRGLLVFAESTGLPISMYFDEPGSPMILSVTDSVLEVNFVLATLSNDPSLRKTSNKRACTPPPPPDDFLNDDMDDYLIALDTSVAPGPSVPRPHTPPLDDPPHTKQPDVTIHRTRQHSYTKQDEEEEEEEDTPDTDRPPNKKFCSLFFGSVLPTSSQNTTQPITSQEVLASDSEEDT